jgi:hypothetical protein
MPKRNTPNNGNGNNNGNGHRKLRRTLTPPLPPGAINDNGNPYNPQSEQNRHTSHSFYKSYQVLCVDGMYCSRDILSEDAFKKINNKLRNEDNAIVLVKRGGPNRNISEVHFVHRKDFKKASEDETKKDTIQKRENNETIYAFLERNNYKETDAANWTILAFSQLEQYWITYDTLNSIKNIIESHMIGIQELIKDRVEIHDNFLAKLEQAKTDAEKRARNGGGRRTKRNKRSARRKTR